MGKSIFLMPSSPPPCSSVFAKQILKFSQMIDTLSLYDLPQNTPGKKESVIFFYDNIIPAK